MLYKCDLCLTARYIMTQTKQFQSSTFLEKQNKKKKKKVWASSSRDTQSNSVITVELVDEN